MTTIFLDLETTGLDPATGRILEIAAARVDAQLNPVDGFACVVLPNPGVGLAMDEYVTNMHTSNGLLAEIAAGKGVSMSDANKAFGDWLHRQRAGGDLLTLAGDSVHFDLAWLRYHLPVAAQHFSHRLFDVSAIGVARRFAGLPDCPIVGTSTHRAQADVLASIAKARWHLTRIVP